MKACFKKVIRFDYLTKLLFMIDTVAILLLLGIVLFAGGDGLLMVLPVVIIISGLIYLRASSIMKDLKRMKDNKVVGKVTGTMRNNGNFYISYQYDVNGEVYKKRTMLLIGPLLKIKLSKMETLNLVIDKENPKKVYIADLLYK